MKYILVVCAVLLSCFAGISWAAANSMGPEPIGPDNTISGNFIQNRYLTGFEAPLVTRGAFFLIPEKGLAWNIIHPFASRLLMTDEGVTQITHGTVMKVENAAGAAKIIADMMYPALAGNWQQLANNFEIVQKASENTGDDWHVTLRPINELLGKIISKIDVKGRSKTRAITVYKANGDRDEIEFSDQKVWSQPPASAIKMFAIEGDN